MPVRGRSRYGAVKLFRFRRAGEGCGGRIAAGNHLRDFVEVARADEPLMRDRTITEFLRGKLFLLKFRVRGHACLRVAARQMEHGHI